MKMKRIVTASLALALSVGPLGAQEGHQHGEDGKAAGMMGMMESMHGMMSGAMMGGMRMGMMGMMGGAHPGPSMILRAAGELGLTEAQKGRLEALAEEAKELHRKHVEFAMKARARAVAALKAEPRDLDAYQDGLEEAALDMVAGRVAMAQAALDAREVLTPEQLDKVAAVSRMCRMMGGGAMESGSMMGGGMMNGKGDGGSGHGDGGGHH